MEDNCIYCKELNEEKENIEVTEILVDGFFYNYNISIIRFCPVCGKKLNRFKEVEDGRN